MGNVKTVWARLREFFRLGFVPRLTIVGVAVLGAIGMGSLVILSNTAERMVTRSARQIDASMEIKFRATLFHLWFEELVQGDTTVAEGAVWGYLEQAKWHARAMLDGGRNTEGEILPLRHPGLRSQIERVLANLENLGSVARRRLGSDGAGGPQRIGSAGDQEFDRVFDEVLRQADVVETALLADIARQVRWHRVLALGLIGFWLLATVGTAAMLFRHERLLSRARDEADRANRAKSAFLAHMSHELRTPLNAIIGFAEIIEKETFGPANSAKYREYAADIHHSGNHLLEVINDILDLSKVEAGRLSLEETEIDLAQVTDSSLRLVKQRMSGSGIRMVNEIPEDLPRLLADERLVRQILLNLVTNAVKFTPRGGEVRLRAEVDPGGELTLCVSDTGVGIAAEDMSVVLERFGQANPFTSRSRHEGSGLGLPLVKSMIELHGGRLELESEIGVGTRVTLTFPRDRVLRQSP